MYHVLASAFTTRPRIIRGKKVLGGRHRSSKREDQDKGKDRNENYTKNELKRVNLVKVAGPMVYDLAMSEFII